MTVTMDRMAERTRKVDGKLTSLLDLGYNQVCVYIMRSVGPNAMRQLEERKEPWIWRDWLVEPLQGQRWRLQRREAGSGEP